MTTPTRARTLKRSRPWATASSSVRRGTRAMMIWPVPGGVSRKPQKRKAKAPKKASSPYTNEPSRAFPCGIGMRSAAMARAKMAPAARKRVAAAHSGSSSLTATVTPTGLPPPIRAMATKTAALSRWSLEAVRTRLVMP
jgi:hypothetical protein